MPEGYRGIPRLTNFGPISRATKEEVSSKWGECPESGRERDICIATKKAAIAILEDQGMYAKYSTLRDINGGKCSHIAKMVLKQLDYVSIWEAGPGSHVWVEYQGKHYDAERPVGVDDPMMLPTNAMIGKATMMQSQNLHAQYHPETMDEYNTVDSIDEVIREATDRYRED